MSVGKPGIGNSEGGLVRDEPPARARDAWSPRRSLGARLALYLVPVAVVPALIYWLLVDRATDGSEQRLLEALVADAHRQEAQALRGDADDAVRATGEAMRHLATIARRAAVETALALEAGPETDEPPETLVDEPGLPLRTARAGASVGLVSRRAASPREARRDLAATRRLEAPFVSLGLGPVDVSAIEVQTATGAMRIIPGRPLTPAGKPIVRPDFTFPSAESQALAALPPTDGPSPVAWSAAYEDDYSSTGKIVTANVLVRGGDGRPLAEVGVDWVFTRVFDTPPDPARPDDAEILVSEDGAVLHAAPKGVIGNEDLHALAETLRKKGAGDLEAELAGRRFLVAARRVPELRWIFAKVSPRASVEKKVRAELDPIFATGRRRRAELRVLYLAAILALSGALAVVTNRALGPVRRVARAADALAAGLPIREAAGLDRGDEVGRLFRAMRNVERRVRWRMASMEGVHRLAQTAALMTRPDETLAQLARQIAQLLGASKAWLALWDPATRSLVGAPPGFGIPEDALRGVRVGLEDASLTMTVYRTGETALGNDLSDPRLARPLLDRLGVRDNYVFAPLKAESGVLGVLGVADKPGGFDVEDQAAIEGYADQAALLLRNARLYEELQRSYERLRDAQRNRDYFLQNVNHELRTPLTAILGWSEVLSEDRPDKETVKIAVDQINRSAQFLLALISDLLDLSRFEEGRTRLEPEEVDLGPLVAGAVEPVSVMAEAKGIAMTVETPAERTPVRLDPMRMRQVLWNLVHNAVKFTPKGGRIRVEASADGAGVTFSVVDNGVGVEAKDLPFIFERFRQVDGSSTRAYRGMGIGLALAKAYVELHGGTIAVESQSGKGTAFRVRIPRAVSTGNSGVTRSAPS